MSLSTHVLDTVTGRPAAGVAIELRRGDELLASVLTDADGRAAFGDVGTGDFELSSRSATTSATRRSRSRAAALPIADAASHYHVPLLVSPWAYSTYRGS